MMGFRRGAMAGVCMLLLAACGRTPETSVPAAAPTDRLGVLRAGQGDAGFERAQGRRQFEFPRDHGPHAGYRHEWWYFTGRLRAADGAQFGFELTFFRLGVAPEGAASASAVAAGAAGGGTSQWRARQVYAAHFAVTDLARRQFHAHARYAREALGLGLAHGEPLQLRVQDWSLTGLPARWRLQADDGVYALDLTASITGAPVLNGVDGLSVKADVPGAASWYYSMPRLPLQGTLSRDGRVLAVSGEAWLDREWGSGGLGPQQQGWDWYALQLSDGSALMFYALRDRDGHRDVHSAGTFVAADGQVLHLDSAALQISVQRYWDSPRGGRYPAGWQVRAPRLGLDLTVTPVLADQELPTQPRYWEGAVDASGSNAGHTVSAQGYVELVGYAVAVRP